jgi:predicted enzyme related to lactoylglutathione lyase
MGRVVHFELHAADPDRARLFYEEVFGWEIARVGVMPYWLVRTGPEDETGIDGGIVQRRGSDPSVGQPVNAYVCTVQVDDLDDTLGRVTDAGGEVVVDRQAILGVGWHAYVKDSEGNLLGVMQPDPAAA